MPPPDLSQRIILHLGSGNKYDPNAVNVDLVASTKPDVVLDLDVTPWPFEDNRFEEVKAFDVLEHLDDIIAVMEEIHRVCRPGAVIKITVPHYSCNNAFTDITHRHYFTSQSFNYFTGENEFNFYSSSRFKRNVSRIQFFGSWVNKVIWRLANKWPVAYERRWAWMFPAWYLYFELEVIK